MPVTVAQNAPSTGYFALPLAQFDGGLNLAAGTEDPDLVSSGEAIDCLNVTFSQMGALRQRYGYAKFTGSALTNQGDSLAAVYTSSGTKRLLTGNGNRIDALNTSGSSVANTTAPTANPHYFARIGTPTAEQVFIANGTDTVRRYTPSTDVFDVPTYTGTTPTARFLAQTFDFRLAAARTSTNPSRVLFSDPGLPTTFGANNYVDLDPGDGEAIMGLVSWADQLFVFKETKFYVFNGVSTDSSGAPVFNYRPVRTGKGLVASKAVVAARDGVYFLDRTGVYRTVGQAPVQLSQKLDPFFTGNVSIYFKSLPANMASISSAAMWFYNERIYLSVPTGSSSTNNLTFQFDPRYGWWTPWDISASAATVFRPANAEEMVFAYPAGTKDIGRYSDYSSYGADNMASDGTGGTATVARWRSGWMTTFQRYRGRWWPQFNVQTIRQAKAWGEGTVTIQLSKDYQDIFTPAHSVQLSPPLETWGDGTDATKKWGDGTDSTNKWGPSGITHPVKIRGIGLRGTLFSVQFSNSTLNRTFALHHYETHFRTTDRPTVIERAD